MKRQSRKLLIIGIVSLLIAGACAAPVLPTPTPTATPMPPTVTVPPPTATPVPPTATVPPPPTVPPAPTQPSFENMLVYDMPEMYQVKIKTFQFQTLHQPPELLTMDVYYPPNWQPGSRLPAVLMANSFPLSAEFGKCGRNCYSYPSWGRLIAANGLIAVTYDTKYANDLEALAKYVRANGVDLGIDGDRLGVMGVSSDAPLAESFAYQEGRDYVKFGVFYYGYLLAPDNFMRDAYNALCYQINCYGAELPDVKQLRVDLPVFVVRCGNDEDFNKEPVDRFAQLATKTGVPLTFVRFDEGSHVFDTLEGSTGQVRVKAAEIVKQTLEFMKAAASGQVPSTPVP
jgi:dienelactone hydrolase